MKRFIKVVAIVFLLALIPSVLLIASLSTRIIYDETYYAELSDMYSRLKNTEGKRLIIVGNSDIAFGTNGRLMEELLKDKGFDYSVCPFGLYGAVGTSAMIDLCKGELREGDVAVFIVEPISSVLTTYFGAESFWKCAENDLSLLLPLSGNKKSALAGNFIPFLQQRIAFSDSGEKPVAEDVYRKDAFDERCDMIYERAGNIMPIGYDTSVPIDFSGVAVDKSFADEMNEFIKHADSRGASVLISFSPVNVLSIADTSDDAVNSFFTLVNETFLCPVISDPNDYIMESGWFYDSNIHLNSCGADVRTAQLADDLLAYWKCRSSVNFTRPEMPSPIVVLDDLTEDSEDLFVFDLLPDGEGYLVSGLTEKGSKSDVLHVPSSHDGKPVVGFEAYALHNAVSLNEIHIPFGVESIPDYLFENCHGLTLIVLEHKSSPCRVGEHLLDGIDNVSEIKILVPRESYPYYRDGIGCDTNTWELYIDHISVY